MSEAAAPSAPAAAPAPAPAPAAAAVSDSSAVVTRAPASTLPVAGPEIAAKPSASELAAAAADMASKEQAAEGAPAPKPEKKDDAHPQRDRTADVTARLASVTQQATAARAQAAKAAAEAKAAADRATAAEAKAAEAEKERSAFESFKKDWKTDPLKALAALGDNWTDVVSRVANFDEGKFTEDQKQAVAEKKLDDMKAEIKAAHDKLAAIEKAKEDEAKTTEAKARLAAEQAAEKGAAAYVTSIISGTGKAVINGETKELPGGVETYPALVALGAQEMATEAIGIVNAAVTAAAEAAAREGRDFNLSAEDSIALTQKALADLDDYYRGVADAVQGKSKQQLPDKPKTIQAEMSDIAASKRNGGTRTITTRVQGTTPQAQQPRKMDATSAALEAMRLARALPH